MKRDNLPILLMTAAIDPRGCGMYSPQEREKQYRHSLAFICRQLKSSSDLFSKVVFLDNSGWDLSDLRNSIPESFRDCFVFCSLPPEDFSPQRGKSYNEMLAMDKIFEIKELFPDETDPLILKVTGRFPILNLRRLAVGLANASHRVSFCVFPQICHFKSPVFRPITWADARCYAIRKSVWVHYLKGAYINNVEGDVYVEDQLDCLFKQHMGELGWDHFHYPPLIVGKQGHKLFYHGLRIPKWIEKPFLLYFWCFDYVVSLIRRNSHIARV